MKAYRIQGTFPMGVFKKQPFTIEVAADNEDDARQRTYSLLGSRHRVDRRHIAIQGINAIDAKDAHDPRVRAALGVEQ